MKSIRENDFFTRKSEEVARDLLGKFICRKNGDTEERFMITETEAYYHDEKDDNGKWICYGAPKTKEQAKRLVSAVLFDKPGTWCVYGGQLLLSVTNDEYPDNVLIKRIKDAEGTIYGPDGVAKTLHLYKKKTGYCGCHGQYSLADDAALYLADGHEVQSKKCKRVNIKNDKEYNFRIKE